MSIEIKLSVHQLVDFLLRKGDIDTRVFFTTAMIEGSRIHASYQAKQGNEYISEYPLREKIIIGEYEFTLEGRADGIIKSGDYYIVDEIKSTVAPLVEFRKEQIDWHLGQAKCYAYMFAKEQHLERIGIRLTYIKQGVKDEKLLDSYDFDFKELETYVKNLLVQYIDFYQIIVRKESRRNETIKNLSFPFEKYRKGQRELAKYAYAVAKNKGKLFVEAPTGIGKTVSTIYPFIKALENNKDGKIFYLTAKNSGKEAAYQTIQILKSQGLSLHEIIIIAKDKICFSKGKGCNPDECPFAKGYYNKIQNVIRNSLLEYHNFNLETLTKIARENEICPFELELDLSLFCDVIICDYNYMFDPLVYMKRYFDADASQHLALIDEAHNLIDRSRDMYSAALFDKKFKEAKKSLKGLEHKKVNSALRRVNKMFLELKKQYPPQETIVEYLDEKIFRTLNAFTIAVQDLNKNENKLMTPELLDFFLDVNKFLKIAELYSDKYISYLKLTKGKKPQISLHLSCLDASKFLARRLDQVKGSVLFSATLSPIDYYINLLGGDLNKDAYLILKSPFKNEQLLLLVAPKVSTKYLKRAESYEEIARYIKTFVSHKVGNYMIYAPSYEYQEKIYPFLSEDKNYQLILQRKEMDDEEKENFIKQFVPNPKKTTIGFAIIGGSFAEGIDLVEDRLIGAVIIGVGLPKINFESDQIAKHFNERGLPGKDYAYTYPGMNKVMQAVGRVIRGEKDHGAVLLVDERYMQSQYQDLFKKEWSDYRVVFNDDELEDELQTFFINDDKTNANKGQL